MCGIVGLWVTGERSPDSIRATVERMRDAVAHRGPDDAGYWAEGPVALGHRRLSILDLSSEGRQPMISADGRYVICYNGEVFNFRELRQELERCGHGFRGGSDTEVMLAAFVCWGVAAAVQRFVGMFAFALWDRKEQTLYLVRDRVGIKPLYVGRTSAGDLLFASELKALIAHPAFSRSLDVGAATSFLRYSYVPAPRSIYAAAGKLLPGHMLVLRSPTTSFNSSTPYWSLEKIAREASAQRFHDGPEEAERALDSLLRDAVRMRMIADVPLGAFLSGGIDSSLVVSLMQAQSTIPVRTFTVGFREAAYDEASFARGVAQHLGTAHTEILVSPKQAQAVIPCLPEIYDEPFADVSQIPTYLVSELAKRHVTVALSGDGGDELFAGYHRYQIAERLWRWASRVSPLLRRTAAGGMRLATAVVSAAPHAAFPQWGRAASRLEKLAAALECRSGAEVYRRLISSGDTPTALTLLGAEAAGEVDRLLEAPQALEFEEQMMLVDTRTYLPDDLLTKLDRASMAVSLEGRVPLLDHRVVEFVWHLPLQFRSHGGETKWLLKRVLARYLPRELFERSKMGFEVPIAEWLRGPLASWGDALLDPRRLERFGFLNAKAVRTVWKRHQIGARTSGHLLWNVLMFEAWREQWNATL